MHGFGSKSFLLLKGVEDSVEVMTLDIGESWKYLPRSGSSEGFLAIFHVNAVSKDLFVQVVGDGCSADKTGDKGDLVWWIWPTSVKNNSDGFRSLSH